MRDEALHDGREIITGAGDRRKPPAGGTRDQGAAAESHRGDPSPHEIARAVRAGCRRARCQRDWLKDVLEHMTAAGWRSDRERHWTAIARVIALHADWRTRCTRPGWERVAALAGDAGAGGQRRPLSRATVARCIAWLRAAGFLGVVESGSTPLIRTGVLYGLSDAGAVNLAAVYVLTTPGRRSARRPARSLGQGQPENETPSISACGYRRSPRARGTAENPAGRTWRACDRPGNRAEELAAAEVIRERSAVLRRLSAAHVAHIARPYWRRGWTIGDFLHALDWRPCGRQWRFEAAVRHPAAWVRWRLSAWHAPDGTPGPSATQRRAAAAEAERRRQDQRRAERARRAALAVPAPRYPAAAATARSQLVAASPAAAAVIARAAIGQPAALRPTAAAHAAATAPVPAGTSLADLARALQDVHDPADRAAVTGAWQARRAVRPEPPEGLRRKPRGRAGLREAGTRGD